MKRNFNYLVRRSSLHLDSSKDFSKVEILMAKTIKINYNHNNYNYSHSQVILSNQSYYSYVTKTLIPFKPLLVASRGNLDDVFFDKSFNADANSRIRVPKCAKRHIERIPRGLLNKIGKNRERVVEICLFVLSLIVNKNPKYEWIKLSSERLVKYTKYGNNNTFVYNHILKVLKYSNGKIPPLIVVKKNNGKETYEVGKECKKYKLSSFYASKSTIEIELTHKDILMPYYSFKKLEFDNLKDNPIVRNILKLYPRIIYPSIQEIIAEAKRLISLNYSKKGKKLIFRKDINETTDLNNYSIVEDCIVRFINHKDRGALSISSSENAGGRVTYNLNLISSWIRNLIKIDDEEIVELDFVAFHPNLAIKIYNGSQKYLTHKNVSEELDLELNQVKKQHLSYFNDEIKVMTNRKVHGFYKSKEPQMVENIINDKKENDYKITSKRMFGLEVQIMTEIIEILNSKGIFVTYIYDALGCKKSDLDTVKSVMNEVVLKFGVYTTVGKDDKIEDMENEENVGIVYKATNNVNGYTYVGTTTKSIEERKFDHFQRIDKNYATKFQDALKEFGKENFQFEQIDTASSINELALKEKKYILEFDSKNNGYNSDTGGGFKKIIYQFDNNGNLKNTFQSLDEASKSVNVTSNSISNACLEGRKTCAGYYWSYNDTLNRREDNRLKPVLQYSLEGELLNEFKSIAIASDETGINKSSIAKCCRGERIKAGEYTWKIS